MSKTKTRIKNIQTQSDGSIVHCKSEKESFEFFDLKENVWYNPNSKQTKRVNKYFGLEDPFKQVSNKCLWDLLQSKNVD